MHDGSNSTRENSWNNRQRPDHDERIHSGTHKIGFVQDIEGLAVKNDDFRRVLYTAKNCQLVLMALKSKEEIGAEVHKLDQFFHVEEGNGEAVLNGVRTPIHAGFAVLVPAGVNHNIINTGNVQLKLYTLYAPPNHRDGVIDIPVPMRRQTTNSSMAKQRNRESTPRRAERVSRLYTTASPAAPKIGDI